jgi:transposase-like protein
MAKPKFDSSSAKGQSKVHMHDEEELAQLLAKSAWTQQEAERVMQAQVQSGQSIAAFAAKHGLTDGRLYNWRARLKQQPGGSEPAPSDPKELEKQVPVQDAQLDEADPGERLVQEHLERATSGPQPTWRLLGVGRKGPALLCVVRWAQRSRDPKPYSLVEMELTEPALRWYDFATLEAAQKALPDRRSRAPAGPRAAAPPWLVPVQVCGPASHSPAEGSRQATASTPGGCVTVCLPSRVRIRIGAQVPETLLRTVLHALGVATC